MITSPLQQVPLPEASDPDNVPYHLGLLTGHVEKRLVQRYSSSTTRDSALPTPEDGMLAVLNADQQVSVRIGGQWLPMFPRWTAYSPSTSGFSLGNAQVSARWAQLGKTAMVQTRITMGSTTSYTAGASLAIGLPVAPAASVGLADTIGSCYLLDANVGSASRTAGIVSVTGNFAYFVAAIAGAGTVSNTVPWTWAVGDVISFNATFEMA